MLHEAAFTVAKVKVPHTDEGIRVAQSSYVFYIAEEALAPVSQGSGVMRADIFKVIETHVSMLCNIFAITFTEGNEPPGNI